MIATVVAALRNALGAAAMVIGWCLVVAGQAGAMVGLALLGLIAIGTLEPSRSVADSAVGYVWQGAGSALTGVVLVYLVGPLIGGRRRGQRRGSRAPA